MRGSPCIVLSAALLLPVAALRCQQPTPSPVPAPADTKAADAIHDRCLTLDTHKDIDSKLAPESLPEDPKTREEFRRRFDPTVRGSQKVDFPKMREGGYDCAFFIVYVGQGQHNEGGYKRALAEANAKFHAIHRMVRRHGDTIGLATTADEVEWLHKDGKLIACIGIENGYPMGEDLTLIEQFHERGARYMSIAHNRHSQLGDSHTPAEPMHGGLSELGRKAIAEMNRVGIMVDISHSSRATMLQAVAASRAPVIASHSGAYAVNAHTRNLDDEQLRALAARGGVVQCVALAEFVKTNPARAEAIRAWSEECGLGRARDASAPELSAEEREARRTKFTAGMPAIDEKHPKANVRDFVDHIDHIVKVIGIDHVGIGTDFDGGGGLDGWNDASESRNVTRELVARGYTEAQIAKIWSGNLLRVWREVEKVAAAPSNRVLKVGSSDVFLAAASVIAEAYGKAHPGVNVEAIGGGSSVAMANLADGKCDVAITTRQAAAKELEAARNKGFEPMEQVIACEDLAIVVNKANPIASLTLTQLVDLWGANGATTSWAQLGVALPDAGDAKVALFGLSNNFNEAFRAIVLNRGISRPEANNMSSSQDVVTRVASMPMALGYCAATDVSDDVKVVPIAAQAGGKPLLPGSSDDSYPLRRTVYAYFRDEPTGSAKGFVAWLRGAEARAVLRERGFLPR